MRLALIYLIKGSAEKYHQKLVKEVGPKFGEMHLIEDPLPSHITLKYPFNTRSLKKIETIIEDIVNKNKKTNINVGGFGHFKRLVVFMKVKFTHKEKRIQKELIKELKKIGVKPQQFDLNFKPHATISYGNKLKTFDKIWGYMKTKKPKNFKIYFDNLTILKRLGEKNWRVYKEFKLA